MNLGCGFGHWSIVLSKAGFQVTAVDISEEAISIVKTWAKEEKVSIETLICPAKQIDHFFKEDFDAVIGNSVLDHMTFKDASLSIKAIKNVLRREIWVREKFISPRSYGVLKSGRHDHRR